MDVVAQKYAEMILLQDFGKAVKIVKDQ
jgi:hypothetical protein